MKNMKPVGDSCIIDTEGEFSNANVGIGRVIKFTKDDAKAMDLAFEMFLLEMEKSGNKSLLRDVLVLDDKF